jgi:UDP-N-acetylmuramate--alanine ligase
MANNRSLLQHIRRVHLTGIGGIGVSAAGRILLARGVRLSGSDLVAGKATRWFAKRRVPVRIGEQRAENVPKRTQLLVHTLAASRSNPEVRAAHKRGIPTATYPELLGELMRGFDGVSVSGTHGKTTTTAMLAEALIAGGLDPTVVVGSFVTSLGGNARVGGGKIFLAEACEYQRAFLHYAPRTIVLTNIEADHLDTYGTFSNLVRAFERYVAALPVDGMLVANADDPVVRRVAEQARCPVAWFSASPHPALKLLVPGAHNQANAAAAVAAAEVLGVDPGVARSAVEKFRGTWRRFEILGTVRGITIVDDYAHHPTAIRATLEAARERFPGRRVVALFEPHHEHRTRVLLSDFAHAFKEANRIVLAPIYRVAGREQNAGSVTSATLASRMRRLGARVELADSLLDAERLLGRILRRDDVLLVMGAGTVTSVAHRARRFLFRSVL